MHNAPFGTGSHRKMSSLLGDQIGGSARAYLADLPLRLRSGHRGLARHETSVFWISMQAIVSQELALMSRSGRPQGRQRISSDPDLTEPGIRSSESGLR
jgi:hypothetical protein